MYLSDEELVQLIPDEYRGRDVKLRTTGAFYGFWAWDELENTWVRMDIQQLTEIEGDIELARERLKAAQEVEMTLLTKNA